MSRAGCGIESCKNVAQLVEIFVNRRVIETDRLGVIARRRGHRFAPQAAAIAAGVGEGSGHADGPDAVQFIGVIETFRLQRLWTDRPVPVAVGLDAVDDILDAQRLHPGGAQVGVGELGRGQMMRGAPASAKDRSWSRAAARTTSTSAPSAPGDARPHFRHAQHVIKVMGRVAGCVELADFG